MISTCRYVLPGLLLSALCGLGQTTAATPATASASATTAAAQSTPAKVEMPSDPAALLALAAKKNGLQNAGSAPWHLKATYEVLDDKGGVKETGTFEEWWVSEKKYKLSYTSPSFNQTDYSTEDGLLRTGNNNWPKGAASMLLRGIFSQFPSQSSLSKLQLTGDDREFHGVTLNCVAEEGSSASSVLPKSVMCFSRTLPILRLIVTQNGLYETVFNEIVIFRRSYVPKDYLVSHVGRSYLHVHLDVLESYSDISEADMTAPQGAIPVVPRIFSPDSRVAAGHIVHMEQPIYPVLAQQKGVSGVVVLHAVIGQDGKLFDVEILLGPPTLTDSALRAVRHWLYKPFMLDGKPVEVDTMIQVQFSPPHS